MAETSATGRYEVLTERCSLGDVGAVVECDNTPSTAALVTAGHLRPERVKSTRESKPEPEEVR